MIVKDSPISFWLAKFLYRCKYFHNARLRFSINFAAKFKPNLSLFKMIAFNFNIDINDTNRKRKNEKIISYL